MNRKWFHDFKVIGNFSPKEEKKYAFYTLLGIIVFVVFFVLRYYYQ